jgi:hypothetical protein
MTSFATRSLSACTALALAFAPVAAAAKSASSLNDLVGARASGAESDMEARGWVVIDGHKGNNAAYSYWWNSSRKDCVMVTTRDGRYAAISDVTPGDCNQKSSGGSNTGAAVGAVAAGALIAALIASSSHKSGNHDNGQHYSDSQKEADYEHGYRDGLHNSPYHATGDRDSYSSGYDNGVQQRERELQDNHERSSGYNDGYRNGGNNSGYSSGYRNSGGGSAQPAEFKDLVGAKAAGAESDLEARGFRNVDGFESGSNGKGTIWWNGRTGQCLQMITVNGRADSIEDIQTHQNCR